MVLSWNRRETVIYDADSEVQIVSEDSTAAFIEGVNTLLQAGWTLDPVLSQMTTELRGATITYSILLVREIPTP